MALTNEDVERMAKLLALVNQGIIEVVNILHNKELQETRTEDENFAHAQKRNEEARKLIEAL